MSPAATPSSSRWCPTPEQVMILEEIYRNGLKTPNATQIQHITSHLSLYGKIEGKNVFYWFQNHKARDRQKLRRKLYKHFQQQHLLMQRHRFDHDNHFFHYFLHHHPLPLPTQCFQQGECEDGSTVAKVEGGDEGMSGVENGGGDGETTTCRNETLRTLELFPVRGSWVKEGEERESGNGGWGN